jgi:hypothetical protein
VHQPLNLSFAPSGSILGTLLHKGKPSRGFGLDTLKGLPAIKKFLRTWTFVFALALAPASNSAGLRLSELPQVDLIPASLGPIVPGAPAPAQRNSAAYSLLQ